MSAANRGRKFAQYFLLTLLVLTLGGCPKKEHVTADFTATPRTGAADLTVEFSGLATPVPPYRLVESKFRDLDRYNLYIVSWSWNFGDGQTGTGQNVNHVYTEPGVYSVTLSLLLSDGTTARCPKVGHVIVSSDNLPPQAQDLQVVAPDEPRAGDGLSIGYVYYDPEDDPQEDTEVRWYKNDVHAPEFDDFTEIPSGTAKHGETWHYLIRVSDGQDWSEWVQSPDITILNTPPVAEAGDDQQVTVDPEGELTFEQNLDALYGLTYNAPMAKEGGMPFVYLYKFDSYIIPITIPALRTIPSFGLGLATDPTTGELWALLGVATVAQQVDDRKEMPDLPESTRLLLATLDPASGVATPVGTIDEKIVDIAFDEAGTLYGLTPDEFDGNYMPVFGEYYLDSPHSLYQIDKETMACTFVMDMGETSNGTGEAIAFNDNDGLLYHVSGEHPLEKDFTDAILDGIDLEQSSLNLVASAIEIYGAPTAMTYTRELNRLLVTARDGYLYNLSYEPGAKDGVPWRVIHAYFTQTDILEGLSLGLTKHLSVADVQLDGSASYDADDETLTYSWSFVDRPEGSLAELSDPTIANPTFVPDVRGEYQIQLIVSDGTEDSIADSVTITYGNAGPVADAGPDQIVLTSDEYFAMGKRPCSYTQSNVVWLNGAGSSDADFDQLQYQWTLISAPEYSYISAESLVTPSGSWDGVYSPVAIFFADAFGDYVFELTVSDGEFETTDQVTITVAQDIETTCAQIDFDYPVFQMGPNNAEIVNYQINPYEPEMTHYDSVYELNCGGDGSETLDADAFFIGGQTRSTDHDFGLFNCLQTQRYWPNQAPKFNEVTPGYSIPLFPGAYGVQLDFAEIDESITGAGQRVFDVLVEGQLFMDDVDVYGISGLYGPFSSGTRYILVLDGSLDIEFVPVVGEPMVSAITVINWNAEPVEEFIKPFGIGRFEITNAQFASVLNYALAQGLLETAPDSDKSLSARYSGGNVYYHGELVLNIADEGEGCDIEFDGSAFVVADRQSCPEGCETISMDNHPVVEVTWYGAMAFCNWYSQMRGLLPFYDLDNWRPTDYFYSKIGFPEELTGYRLPFEPEWEYAAAWEFNFNKGQGIFGRHLVFGTWADHADATEINYAEVNPLGLELTPYTTPVGYYEWGSPVDCYDMSGNVAEWVFGRAFSYPEYDPYGDNEYYDKGEWTADERIIRGGSWADDEYHIRTAYRTSEPPETASNRTGFRVASWSSACIDFGGFK